MGPDGLLFIFSILDEGALLFLAVYFVITLSDLECDYLNARGCCDKLNYWVVMELISHNVLSVILLLGGHWLLFLCYAPIGCWLTFKYFTKPKGNMGLFDPTEIHNQKHLKQYMRESLVRLGFHLVFFFIFLYWMIYSLVKGI